MINSYNGSDDWVGFSFLLLRSGSKERSVLDFERDMAAAKAERFVGEEEKQTYLYLLSLPLGCVYVSGYK